MNHKLSIMKIIINPKTILGLIISIGGIYWAFRDFEFRFFYNTLQVINYNYILLAGLLLWGSVYLRALRWEYFFQVSVKPDVTSLYRSEMIGYFGNYVLPLRLGEILRAYIIGKEWNLSKTYVFGTVILERLLDAISLILLSFLLVFVYPLDGLLIKNIFWMGVFGIFLILIAWKILHRIKIIKNNNVFMKHFQEIINGLQSINPSSIFPLVILSILIWSIYLIDVYLLQCAFHFNLNFPQILMVLVLSHMALAIPAAPGMIGTFHAAVKYTIVDLFGFSSIDGNSFALVMHAYGYILLTLIGCYYFIRNRFSTIVLQTIIEEK